METAAQSAEPEIAEELLHYFVDNGERECFAASLYTCYDLIKPDVAMEVNLCFCFNATDAAGMDCSPEWTQQGSQYGVYA